MTKEMNFFLISDSIEIIYESEEIELWEISLLNLSIHRIINKVALEILERESNENLLDELHLMEQSKNVPRQNKIPKIITTRVKSVSNGSIHQIIELGSSLEVLVANREFVSGVLASLSVNVISSIVKCNINNVRTLFKKDGKRAKLTNNNVHTVNVSPNIVNLSEEILKNKKPTTKFKIKLKTKNIEVAIEMEKK